MMPFKIVVALCLFQSVLPSQADPFSNVPERQRNELREIFAKMIEGERTRQWAMLFALTGRPSQEKAAFIANKTKSSRLESFSLKTVTYIPPDDEWVISGCAHFRGMSHGIMATVHAKWKNEMWQLTPVSRSVHSKGGTMKCVP
jgi:hypothetical protein